LKNVKLAILSVTQNLQAVNRRKKTRILTTALRFHGYIINHSIPCVWASASPPPHHQNKKKNYTKNQKTTHTFPRNRGESTTPMLRMRICTRRPSQVSMASQQEHQTPTNGRQATTLLHTQQVLRKVTALSHSLHPKSPQRSQGSNIYTLVRKKNRPRSTIFHQSAVSLNISVQDDHHQDLGMVRSLGVGDHLLQHTQGYALYRQGRSARLTASWWGRLAPRTAAGYHSIPKKVHQVFRSKYRSCSRY